MEYLSVGDTALFYEPAVALVQGKDADAIISVQIFSITATFHFLAEFIIKLRSASEAFLPIFTRFSHHYIFRPVNLNQQAYSYYFPCIWRLDYADWTQHSRLWILYTCMCSSSTWSGYHEDGFSVFLWGDRWCFLPLVHLLESQGYSALGSPPEMIGIISVWVSFGTLPGLSPKMIVFGICSLHPT